MSEAQLVASVLLTHSHGPTRIFRFNAGVSWAGAIVHRTARILTLADYHPVKLAPEGFPDTAGWTTVEITPDMIGQKVAVFVGVECKFGRNKPTPPQSSFIDTVNKAGGRAGVAYSVEEAGKIIRP